MAENQRRLTPPELAVEVSAFLRAAGINHALGGALALGFHAEPRGTLDVDMNIFVAADAPIKALDVLAANGVALNIDAARNAIATRGDLFLEHRGCRLDLFFNSIPFQVSASRRTQDVDLLGKRVPILSREDLIVVKLLFNRHKDIVDIERLVETSTVALDARYVRHWLVKCVRADDPRLATWDAILPPNAMADE